MKILIIDDGNHEIQHLSILEKISKNKFIKINNLSNKSPGYNIAHSLNNYYYSLKNKKTIHPNFYDGYLLHNLIAKIKKSSDEQKWINI